MDTVSKLSPRLEKIERSLAVVTHEVLPNGGGSLRDVTTRTEAAVGAVTITAAEQSTQIADIDAGVRHIKRQVASQKTTLAGHSKQLALLEPLTESSNSWQPHPTRSTPPSQPSSLAGAPSARSSR
jgi:uncharacterized coiled-coil protein SlyX